MRTILIVIVLIGIGISAYLTLAPLLEPKNTASKSSSRSQPAQNTDKVSTPKASLAPSPTPAWSAYECVQLGFSLTHPADLLPEKRGETIVFSKWGPSQKTGTGFYDGISLVFDDGGYEGSFSAFVRNELEKTKEWPTFESATEPEAVAVAGREAWSFRVTSMLESTYIYIKKDNGHFFRITNNTQDPTNQGFAQIVEQMIESLRLK